MNIYLHRYMESKKLKGAKSTYMYTFVCTKLLTAYFVFRYTLYLREKELSYVYFVYLA